jgi:aminoglycoside phosphotransferase (APT) family kinase protein
MADDPVADDPTANDAELTGLLVPEPDLRRWADGRLPGDGPLDVRRVTTGHSNELFLVSREGQEWMLRRPPRVVNVAGAHDMAREYRLLEALEGSAVPHPVPVAVCEDPDVIGAPFYVMSRIDGIRLYDGLPAAFDNPEARRQIAFELFGTLAELHKVDWEAAGLAGFGKPETFTQRQVGRWMKQLNSYRVRDLPDLDTAAEWLEAHTPTMQRAALIHGDYGLHNVLFAPDDPGRLVAVLDWETATIGDPLIDIGYLLSLWLEPGEEEQWFAVALPYDVTGYPTRAELAAHYAERSGLSLDDIAWYRAVAQLKVACIMEGGYARYRGGHTDDPQLARYEQIVPNHAAYVLAIIRGTA